MNPAHDIAAHVRIVPMEHISGRIVEVIKTVDEGWIYVVRYITNGEAKTMRCFPDELEPA